jgi:hypothetical protein
MGDAIQRSPFSCPHTVIATVVDGLDNCSHSDPLAI